MTLNLFPARAPIGRADSSGQVLMTPEFARALAALLERVGGVTSPSLTTVVNQLGDVTNIVNSIGEELSFPGQIQDAVGSESVNLFNGLAEQTSKIEELRILLDQSYDAISSLSELIKLMQDFSIQASFSPPPPSPVALAADAVDLPTVIALANSMKQALKSNGIGS